MLLLGAADRSAGQSRIESRRRCPRIEGIRLVPKQANAAGMFGFAARRVPRGEIRVPVRLQTTPTSECGADRAANMSDNDAKRCAPSLGACCNG
jgi:hypothetical protein